MSIEVTVDVRPPTEITVAESPDFDLTILPPPSIQIGVDSVDSVTLEVPPPNLSEISIAAPTIFELAILPPPIVEFNVGIAGTGGGGGGGGGDNEVTIGGPAPYPPVELWVDLDDEGAPPSGGGGTIGPLSYVHTQAMMEQDWVVVHGLGWYPNVQTFDATGYKIHGSVTHDSDDQLTVHFAFALTGKAYCS